MNTPESDFDRRMEYLVKTAVRPGHVLPGGLSTYEMRLITISRLVMSRTMLSLAVKLEAGVKPQMPEQAK